MCRVVEASSTMALPVRIGAATKKRGAEESEGSGGEGISRMSEWSRVLTF